MADVDAAGVGGQIPGTQEKHDDSGEGPKEELHGEGGQEQLMGLAVGAGGPGEQESAEEGDTGGEGETE